MPILESSVDLRSEAFARERAAMLALLANVRELEARVRTHSESKAAKFSSRGQLLPRDRVARVLDRGSPFLEMSTLAGFRMHDDDGKRNIAGGGNIVGIGFVSGKRCLVTAADSAIKDRKSVV